MEKEDQRYCGEGICPFSNGGGVYEAVRWKQRVEDRLKQGEIRMEQMEKIDEKIRKDIESIKRAIWIATGVVSTSGLGLVIRFILMGE